MANRAPLVLSPTVSAPVDDASERPEVADGCHGAGSKPPLATECWSPPPIDGEASRCSVPRRRRPRLHKCRVSAGGTPQLL